MNSAQKLNLNKSSSHKKQDSRKDAREHGREFLRSVLLYRKISRVEAEREEIIDLSCSAGTRICVNEACVPKQELMIRRSLCTRMLLSAPPCIDKIDL